MAGRHAHLRGLATAILEISGPVNARIDFPKRQVKCSQGANEMPKSFFFKSTILVEAFSSIAA
jgi:hypothetical protein